MRALLITNAKSGSAEKLPRSALAGDWVDDPASVSVEQVAEYDLLALFGGDGTMQMTLSQLLRDCAPETLPPIALLPFGTTNMNARDLNRNRSHRGAMRSLAQVIETGQMNRRERPLLKIHDGDRIEHGYFFALGFIAETIERWNAERKPGAFINNLRSLWAMIIGLTAKRSATKVALDGHEHELYALLATTLDRLLFGARPYWGTSWPGDLRCTWIDADAPDLFRHAPHLLRGREFLAERPGYESRVFEALELDFQGPYVIDGEIFHPGPAGLRVERSAPINWVSL